MPSEAATPLTDAAEVEIIPSRDPNYDGEYMWVPSSLARTLERDLAHAEQARTDLRNALDAATETIGALNSEAVKLRVAVDQTMAARNELQRRLTEILDLIDGREDIDNNGGPNIFMRIAMTARGEDKP